MHLITRLFALFSGSYLGRKRLQNREELYVANATRLVHPSYSYWTLGYIITLQGVKKLLGKPTLAIPTWLD